MNPYYEQLREDALTRIDNIISIAYAAKELTLTGKFWAAANALEGLPGPVKQASAWLAELPE